MIIDWTYGAFSWGPVSFNTRIMTWISGFIAPAPPVVQQKWHLANWRHQN